MVWQLLLFIDETTKEISDDVVECGAAPGAHHGVCGRDTEVARMINYALRRLYLIRKLNDVLHDHEMT